MKRRTFLKKSAALSAATIATPSFSKSLNAPKNNSEYVVIGGGIFGIWSAFYLQELGANVTVVDAYGPGNSRSSSGGESRILRADYGEKLVYTKMNNRAHELWSNWQKEWGETFMFNTGRLTLGAEGYKASADASKSRLAPFGIEAEVLGPSELKKEWPQINFDQIEAGLYYPGGAGGSTLMARQATRTVGEQFVKRGGNLIIGKAEPGKIESGTMKSILVNGEELTSDNFVFACGPWMGKLFPKLFGDRLRVVRRDVLFVGTAAGDDRYSYPNLPVWTFTGGGFRNYYGMPDIHGRGLKVAPWPDNNSLYLDKDDRVVNTYEIKRVREFVGHRFPGLKDQPILEGRVCQLTFSEDEHFIIDQHPEAENAWFVCAGSGHGFKHGPALGEYVANRVILKSKNEEYDSIFSSL